MIIINTLMLHISLCMLYRRNMSWRYSRNLKHFYWQWLVDHKQLAVWTLSTLMVNSTQYSTQMVNINVFVGMLLPALNICIVCIGNRSKPPDSVSIYYYALIYCLDVVFKYYVIPSFFYVVLNWQRFLY